MKKIKRYAGFLFLMIFGILGCSMSVFADEMPQINVPVKIGLTGGVPYKNEDLTVVLTAEDLANPMPEGSLDGTYKTVITGENTVDLKISYPKVGIYKYTIHQEPGTYKNGEYDKTVYQMVVYVTNVETGGIEATTVVYIDDTRTKYERVDFVNNYKRIDNGDRDDDTEKPTPPPTTAAPPTEAPTTAPSPSTSTPTPDELDLYNIGNNGIPLGDMGLWNLGEGGIPLAVLPATGTLWWLAAVLACVGAVMFLAGFYRNRSCDKDEE